jgi:hypothetical protein
MRYLIFTVLLLPIVIGCSNNNPQGRVAVRGEVTLDGKPLEQGEILFSSVAGNTPVVVTGSPIQSGKFSLSAEQGIIPEQTYRIRFRSVKVISNAEKEKENKHGEFAVQTQDIIPLKYGVESKETVTATRKSPNMFKFDLTSDAGK